MELFLLVGGVVWAIWFFGTKTSDGKGKSSPTSHSSESEVEHEARDFKQISKSAPAIIRPTPKPTPKPTPFAFCALDTETTGIVPRSHRHRAFEISCVRFTPTGDGRKYKKESFTRYIRVDVSGMKRLKLSRMWESHSSSGRQRDAIEAVAALHDLREFVQDLPLVCHNAAFDKCVIENEIKKVSYSWKPENRWICTLLMARYNKFGTFVGYSPGRDDGMSYKLEHVARSLSLPLDPSKLHLGHYDAEVAGTLFLKLHHLKSVPIKYVS